MNTQENRSSRPSLFRLVLVVVIVSCLVGALVGVGTAVSALTINGWNPELEHTKHADLLVQWSEQNSNPNAKAFIENNVHDFGLKDIKEKGKHDFVIRNDGTAVLTLKVNRTTCTCTGIDLSHKSLSPGQSAVATVNYDAERATTGPYEQGGTVVTNDPENREIYLGIKGIFTSPVVVSPGSVYFSTIAVSGTDSSKIRFLGFEKEPLKLEPPQWSDHEHFDFVLTPSELTEADKEDRMNKNASSVYEGTVTVKPGLPIGTFQEKFVFKTNYPSEPTVEILVRGKIVGSGVSISGMGYDKETGALTMGTTSVGRKLVRDLLIQFSGSNTNRADLKITEVRPTWLKTTLTQPRDLGSETSRRRFYTLTVEVPANAVPANFQKSDAADSALITLETGLDDVPPIRIPVQFIVTGP